MKQVSCAELLKLVGDRVRLDILLQLQTGPKWFSELQQATQIEQSLLSHHLKTLKTYDLIQSHREGRTVRYELCEDRALPSGIDLGCCRLDWPRQKHESAESSPVPL